MFSAFPTRRWSQTFKCTARTPPVIRRRFFWADKKIHWSLSGNEPETLRFYLTFEEILVGTIYIIDASFRLLLVGNSEKGFCLLRPKSTQFNFSWNSWEFSSCSYSPCTDSSIWAHPHFLNSCVLKAPCRSRDTYPYDCDRGYRCGNI